MSTKSSFAALLFFTLFFLTQCTAQKLVSGPMPGYTEHFESLIWLEVASDVLKVEIKYRKLGDQKFMSSQYDGPLQKKYNPIKFQLQHLEMGSTYEYELWIDGKKTSSEKQYTFSTRKLWEYREAPPEFSFIIGSCAYINDTQYDRPGDPYGQDYRIFKTIENNPSEFMIWLGDNNYLREVDWSSESGIQYRYHNDRKLPEMQGLLSSRNHFATWDDHDYGPNDSDKSYRLKNVSLQAFKDYWGNQTYGEDKNPGVYSSFSWADADFFLLDNRYHRSNNRYPDDSPEKTFLGNKQMEWLKNSLLSSRARFKFIVCGSQMLNLHNRNEAFARYANEFEELMNFIVEADIWGVVFISGDRHFSEIIKREQASFYTLYDITSSPLTARPYFSVLKGKEGENPDRVEGKVAVEQNFIKISVQGEERTDRNLLIQCFDIDNKELWNFKIDDDQLRPARD
ncbi:MAG: alkaline phosphatase family protein [Chitinophagales bacterium]|nr:alkaline phosphatase family protein [Chitinophagales bacterium]